jgi:hypothetical protein
VKIADPKIKKGPRDERNRKTDRCGHKAPVITVYTAYFLEKYPRMQSFF